MGTLDIYPDRPDHKEECRRRKDSSNVDKPHLVRMTIGSFPFGVYFTFIFDLCVGIPVPVTFTSELKSWSRFDCAQTYDPQLRRVFLNLP